MAQHVYHWKHGWIPLDHVAALSKAKGNHARAAAMLADAHGSRGIQSRQDVAKAILALPTIKNPAHQQAAMKSIREAAHRLGAEDLLPGAKASNVPSTKAPATPAEAFRMGGPELKQHAANGSPVAQAEIDRRAAKRSGGTKATPPAPTPPPVKAAERKPDDLSKTPSINLQAAIEHPGTSTEAKAAMRAELRRRGVIPIDERTAPPEAPKATAHDAAAAATLAKWDAEDKRVAPTGYTIKSKAIGTRDDGAPQGIHTQYTATGERIGSVVDAKAGGYLATYDGKRLGTFNSREEAHQALADAHKVVADAARKKADEVARRQAKATRVGQFDPHRMESDGTKRGDAAAAKVKQSFKLNDHTVHIETALTKDQTKALLDDIHAVLLKSGNLDAQGITFHVPTGDSKFRASKRGGLVGGYVRQGDRRIFINPKVANGDVAGSFGGPTASDSLMPAARKTTDRQYVITHELGHVLDNQHSHTRETSLLGSRQVAYTSARESAAALHKDQRSGLSKYGQTNVAEGYAEAYAQWIHGGPGSSPTADAYAAQFGWVAPKWYREGKR